uniref:Uncharacterized protein n=1 Tax=Ditylenchus dipsaci TaxID=166011 RepID=A0A915DD27_9BILA
MIKILRLLRQLAQVGFDEACYNLHPALHSFWWSVLLLSHCSASVVACPLHRSSQVPVQEEREEELKQQKSEIKQQLEVSCVADEGAVKADPFPLPPGNAPLQEVTASSYSAEEKKEITAQSSTPNCEMTADSTSFNAQKKQPKKDVVPVSAPAPPAAPVVPAKSSKKRVPAAAPKKAAVIPPATIKKSQKKKKAKKRTTANAIQRFFVRQFTELSLSEGSERDVEAECDNDPKTAVDPMIAEETADNKVDAGSVENNPEITQNQTMHTETQQTCLSEEYAGKDEKLRKKKDDSIYIRQAKIKKTYKRSHLEVEMLEYEPITLAIHSTIDYVHHIIDQASNWDDFISYAVLIRNGEERAVAEFWNLWHCNPLVRRKVSMHLLWPKAPFQQTCQHFSPTDLPLMHHSNKTLCLSNDLSNVPFVSQLQDMPYP